MYHLIYFLNSDIVTLNFHSRFLIFCMIIIVYSFLLFLPSLLHFISSLLITSCPEAFLVFLFLGVYTLPIIVISHTNKVSDINKINNIGKRLCEEHLQILYKERNSSFASCTFVNIENSNRTYFHVNF